MQTITIPQISSFPKTAQINFLMFLDIKSILNLQKSGRENMKILNDLLDQYLWKSLCLRDFPFFIIHSPSTMENAKDILMRSGDIVATDTELQASKSYENYEFMLKNIKYRKKAEEKALSITKSWKNFFKENFLNKSIGGVYMGYYGAHGVEKLQVYQKGYYLIAVKLTGDNNVPAGKISWKIKFDSDFKRGAGKIHLADSGFKSSRWGFCEAVRNEDSINVSWFYKIMESASEIVYLSFTFENRRIEKYEESKPLLRSQEYVVIQLGNE